ncbi:MAG: glucose-6-phosphate isomerase [Pseudomonadota bacterium]
MNGTALWQRYQDWLYYHEGLGFYLDISRVRFDAGWAERMEERFAGVFEAMARLERGAVANPDENRMVGHYWLRAPELAPTEEIRAAITRDLEHIELFSRQVHEGAIRPPEADRFTDILSIGIGGSALGPQFVASALAPAEPALAIHFIDNTDPAGIDRVLHRLQGRLKSTLVLDTTKSGGTPEPRNALLEVKHALEAQGLTLAPRAVAITMEGSRMDEVAHAEGWLAEFPMYDWIGGRTSEMSAVGLLPAALQGIDIRSILAGAREMDAATRVADFRNNPAALLAACWHHCGDGSGKKDMVMLPYKDSLLLLSRYLQQLVMESLGKEKDLEGRTVHQGLAVYGNKGSTDQHAYVQQLRDGIPNFFATFVEVLEDRDGPSLEIEPGVTSGDYLSGFLQGTRQALYENHRDSITLTIPRADPLSVGALIALYERAVGFYASLVNINAYHQPGVEAGKKAAASILELQKKIIATLKDAESFVDLTHLAESAGASDKLEAVYMIVRHLEANRRGVALEGNRARPQGLKVRMESRG